MLCIVLISTLIAPFAVNAKSTSKTVRVGWYESTFNTTGSSGQRSGYGYEYQMKVAAYTGWNYTYVHGSWAELMEMLKEGKIDILSDVSYTEERTKQMLFPDLPMGTEEYCIFISPDNTEITSDDFSTLNGKRIGIDKGSIQKDCYDKWAKKNGIKAKVVDLVGTESESVSMLKEGDLDAYITPNAFVKPDDYLVSVCKIGSSDYYFAVNNSRDDLLKELNSAMNRIQDEKPYYNQRMFEKYVRRMGPDSFLNSNEKTWLSSHPTIRVGYQDDYLPFCAKDPKTGELTGALKDYLKYASGCLKDAKLEFTTTAYPTSSAALEALKQGEIDCVFPANLSSYYGETQNVNLTPSVMRADVYAVVRKENQNAFSDKEHVLVAVKEGDINFNSFIKENYPSWRSVSYPDIEDCLKAVSDGTADCILMSSIRYNNNSRLCKKYHLTNYNTDVGIDYCFMAPQGNTELYSILSKVVGLVPSSNVNSALSYYIAENAKPSFLDMIAAHLILVMAAAAVVVIVILFLFMRSRKAEKKAKKLISATETDRLTGLYNRDYFFQYADSMYRSNPDTPRDAIVLNIEQFHSINALNGRAFGDQVLCTLGGEILTVANEFNGIGGRFGADRFDIYCRHIEDYQAVFDRLQSKLDTLASNVSVRLRMGVMPWQSKIEPMQLFDRARTACNMARGNYKDHMIVYDEKVRERELLDQQLLNDLRRALDSHEFEVYYQPKFDIRTEPPKLVGAEALIRWKHPEMGMIMPGKFIPLFERNGKISEVDKYVWATAAKQISEWKKRYGITLPVSVNLSRVDVFQSELEGELDEILKREGLEHSALELEITESAYTENANQLIHVAKTLHRKGYTIEMDDFGTGYSSLNMLSSMPIDVLKMDREFIRNMENNQKDTQMVSLIIGIAMNLGIPVIAEGVETKSELNMLRHLGCDYVQGYYFSCPLSASDFEEKYFK